MTRSPVHRPPFSPLVHRRVGGSLPSNDALRRTTLHYDSFELILFRHRLRATITLPIQCEAPSNYCQELSAGCLAWPVGRADSADSNSDGVTSVACRSCRKSVGRGNGRAALPVALAHPPQLRRQTLG